MNDIIIEGLSTVISLAVGGLIGYVVAYVTGLRAIRKGMQPKSKGPYYSRRGMSKLPGM